MLPDENASATTEETSLRDDILAAMSGADSQEETVTKPVVQPTNDGAEQPKEGRSRDDQGKFVKQAEDKTATIPEVKADKPETETATQPAAIEPPKSWNAEARQHWAEIPTNVREYIVQRDKEQADGVAKLKQTFEGKARFADEIWAEVAPHAQLIQAEGGTPQTAIRTLLNDAYLLRTGSPEQKARLFMERAAQFGVDLTSLANLPPPQRPDPYLTAIQQELAQLKGFVSQSQRAAAEQQQAQLMGEIEAFKADKPHFDAVAHTMGVLIETGKAKGLDDAYDMAVYADPTIRAKVLAEQQAKAVQEKAVKASQVSSQAKAKAVSVTGAPGGSSAASAPPEDLRALIASQVYGEGRA